MAAIFTSTSSRKRAASHDDDDKENVEELANKYSLLSVAPSDDVGLTIDNLPSLVIRKIMKMEQESIETMKLISPRWNALATDLLTHGQCVFGIKKFVWSKDFHGRTHLYMRLPLAYRSFFGVEHWTVQFTPNFGDPERSIGIRFDAKNNAHESRLFDRISRHLSRCSRIETMELKMDFFRRNGAEIEIVKKSMKGIFIEELRFTGILNFNDAKYTILEILRNNQVCRLTLSVYDICRMRFGKFFSEASRLVSSIELRQEKPTPFFDLARMQVPWREATLLLRKIKDIRVRFETDRLKNGSGVFRITVRKHEEEETEEELLIKVNDPY